jgi:hypothetical protein
MVGIDTSPKNVSASSPRRNDNWASDHGDSARRGVREYESLGLLRNEHCRNRGIAPAPASIAELIRVARNKCGPESWGPRSGRRPHERPVYRYATLLRSEFLDGYIRPFPSQVGQERNAGTFMRSWSDCTAPTHPFPRQLGHPSYRRHFLGRSADVIHSCLPASSRSNAAAGRA